LLFYLDCTLAQLYHIKKIERTHVTNIEEYIAPKGDVVAYYKNKLKSPLIIGLFFYVAIAEFILPIGSRAIVPFHEKLIINVSFMTALWLSNFYFGGYLVWECVRRNIPFAWVIFAFYSFLILILKALVIYNRDRDFGFYITGRETIELLLLVGIAVFAGITALKNEILEKLAVDPKYFPLWKPVKRQLDKLQPLLPSDTKGNVHRIHSNKQIVTVVTESGQTDIRMSLKEAVDLVGQEKGIRIHRSNWLANDQITELLYRNGNPAVKTESGDIFPVSRDKVAEVKNLLK